jgi:hypothetical protein
MCVLDKTLALISNRFLIKNCVILRFMPILDVADLRSHFSYSSYYLLDQFINP